METKIRLDYSDVKFKGNGKLKLLIIVGTRPEIIRLAAVINKCRQYFDCILAHTGQNYDYNLNGVFFKDLKLADPEVYMDAVGDDLGATVGNIINCSYKLMAACKPDALLILGDTNSCLSAIPAKRLHIPIFHMEAGNRCKDECLPEETNRRIVDIISDVNLAYSEHARRYLADCGLPKERTYVTGSPMAEVLHSVRPYCFPADFAQASIRPALSPKVTSTTFWTSSKSEAAAIASLPRSMSIFPIPAATNPLATPFRNLLKEFSMLLVESSTDESHFLLSFSMFWVMPFMVLFMSLSSHTTSKTTLPSAILSTCPADQRSGYVRHVAAVPFFSLLFVVVM